MYVHIDIDILIGTNTISSHDLWVRDSSHSVDVVVRIPNILCLNVHIYNHDNCIDYCVINYLDLIRSKILNC